MATIPCTLLVNHGSPALCFLFNRGLGWLALCGGGSQARLHFTRHVRDDAHKTLDEHQLSAMVHFVLLHGENHFEAAFGWRRRALRHLHLLPEKVVGEPLNPSSPFLAGAAKHVQNLLFAAGFLFFRNETLHERRKVETYKRGSALNGMDLVLKVGSQCEMSQQLANAARVRRGPERVLLFGKVLSDDHGILADGAETVGQILG